MSTANHKTPNRRAQAEQSGRKSRVYRNVTGIGESVHLIKEFVKTDDADKRSRIIEKVERTRQIRAIAAIGAMCIDTARVHSDQAEAWLTRATDSLTEFVALTSVSGLGLAPYRARNQRLLASMPHYYSVILHNELPSADWNTAMTTSLTDVARETHDAYQAAYNRTSDSRVNRDTVGALKGELSEQAVQLLALRAAQKIGSESWSPVPSYFSQDHAAAAAHSPQNHSWDLTVQTTRSDTNTPPIEDTYLIQVKACDNNYNGLNKAAYAADISVVTIDDLCLDGERTLHPARLIRDLVSPTDRIERRTERRIELLLDILD